MSPPASITEQGTPRTMHSVVTRTLLLLGLFAALVLPVAPLFAQTIPGVTAAKPAAEAPALSSREAAEALIRVLEDEAARKRLVEELRRQAEPPPPEAPAPAAEAPAAVGAPTPPAGPEDTADPSLARELGEYTQAVARETADFVTKIWRGLANLTRLLDGSTEIDWTRVADQVVPLLGLIFVAFSALLILQWFAQWPLRGITAAAARMTVVGRVVLLAVATFIDLAVVALAWVTAGAWLVANTVGNRIELIESLFLNAFVLIEVTKVFIRAVFQPRRPPLRVFPISDATARYWNFRLARLVGFLGYGVMLVVPIVNSTIAFAVGLGVRLVIVLTSLITTIVLVLRNRANVRAGLIEAAMLVRGGAVSAALATLARVWHFLVIAYVLVAFVVWVTRPFDAVGFMATATLQTFIVLAVGGGLMGLMNRTITGGIRLPADIKRALPLLENRLNLLVPTFLRVIRIFMFVLVAAFILQAWQLIDVTAWMETDRGRDMVGRFVTALIIVLVAMAIWIAATSWIEYRLNPASGRVSTARARTLFSLFRNAFSIVIVVITAMLALSELGVDIAPLIAGAGVLGLAVGFGSQKLVQDIITGAFIQFENAMNEGDVVTVAGISGVVERLTIRSVGLRDANGVYHVVPFSSVDAVSNAMRGFAFHVADISVAYRENIKEVKRLMGVAFERLMATPHGAGILEPLEMNGIVQMTESAVVIRARIKTIPGQQWAVGRAYTELVKEVFDENGIEIPFPQQTLWFGRSRDGEPPELRLVEEHDENEHPAEPPARPVPRTASEVGAPRRHRARPPRQTIDVPDSPDDGGR
ncbi:mechanosensitive ion channel domain-containing protein [Chthonobacter albigriseus]|uniref:mechanosensitive ion channel domain-containing protein n=1 Tax=Chthonobacter albigriseus TaxID=1683161 RepID=UPI0015EF2A3B|nr:mechanosensitive ion channel domain-containing protein [Chthonobacter albigriseus]